MHIHAARQWTGEEWVSHGLADPQALVDLAGFFADLEELVTLVEDANVDLTAKIPHGQGRTYLREILLVADHNAYHLGQIVQARKLLGDWRG